jgi:hypothetical protein
MTISGTILDESAKAELSAARQSLRVPGSLLVCAAVAFGRTASGTCHGMLGCVFRIMRRNEEGDVES